VRGRATPATEVGDAEGLGEAGDDHEGGGQAADEDERLPIPSEVRVELAVDQRAHEPETGK
jgi:hypothetical protein